MSRCDSPAPPSPIASMTGALKNPQPIEDALKLQQDELAAAERKMSETERTLAAREGSLKAKANDLWRRTLRLKHAAMALTQVQNVDPEVAAIVRRICRRPFPVESAAEGADEALKLREQAVRARAQAAEQAEATLTFFERDLSELAEFLEREAKELIQRQHALLKRQAVGATLETARDRDLAGNEAAGAGAH